MTFACQGFYILISQKKLVLINLMNVIPQICFYFSQKPHNYSRRATKDFFGQEVT